MRNPLKRLARRDPQPKVPLRERLAQAKGRLAAGKAKAAQLVAANRMMLAPPKPSPAVDRVALTNYATFLAWERFRVCAELYPHMGRKAVAFVLTLNAADRFFYSADGHRRSIAPPASTRALKVLDLVGIDWREDGDEASFDRLHGSHLRDNGERAAVPHNWPAPDAALLEALDDLVRLDAACQAVLRTGDASRDHDDVPSYDAIDLARRRALSRLATERAESLIGLQAKARAMLVPTVEELPCEHFADIAQSLARDLLEALPRAVEPQPDPIFAVIEKARRLCAEHTAACNPGTPSDQPDPPEVIDRRADANDDLWAFVDGTLLKTVPISAEGCKALAAFVGEFVADQDVPLDGASASNDPVLALIARSPLF